MKGAFIMPTNETSNIYSSEYADPTPIDASAVTYDGAESGLSATNVQGAIDELEGEIPSSFDADEITYDNTTSGLIADDVQEAIDEVNGKFADISQFPLLPSDATNGTYKLQAVKADGVVTYSWTAVV